MCSLAAGAIARGIATIERLTPKVVAVQLDQVAGIAADRLAVENAKAQAG